MLASSLRCRLSFTCFRSCRVQAHERQVLRAKGKRQKAPHTHSSKPTSMVCFFMTSASISWSSLSSSGDSFGVSSAAFFSCCSFSATTTNDVMKVIFRIPPRRLLAVVVLLPPCSFDTIASFERVVLVTNLPPTLVEWGKAEMMMILQSYLIQNLVKCRLSLGKKLIRETSLKAFRHTR